MSEVLAGDFDLRVPVVTAVIDSYTQLSISDVVVELVVSCGTQGGPSGTCSPASSLGPQRRSCGVSMVLLLRSLVFWGQRTALVVGMDVAACRPFSAGVVWFRRVYARDPTITSVWKWVRVLNNGVVTVSHSFSDLCCLVSTPVGVPNCNRPSLTTTNVNIDMNGDPCRISIEFGGAHV